MLKIFLCRKPGPASQTSKTAGFYILWASLPQRAGALHFTCDSLRLLPPSLHFLPLLAFRLDRLLLESAEACLSVLALSRRLFSPTVSLGSRALAVDFLPAVNTLLFIGWDCLPCFISPAWQWKVIISGFDLNIGRESKLPQLMVNGRKTPGGLWREMPRECKRGKKESLQNTYSSLTGHGYLADSGVKS